jgi:hypothetical protein
MLVSLADAGREVSMGDRVEWHESRGGELFFVIGERVETAWRFWERSSWENQWYSISSTDALRDMANAKCADARCG